MIILSVSTGRGISLPKVSISKSVAVTLCNPEPSPTKLPEKVEPEISVAAVKSNTVPL